MRGALHSSARAGFTLLEIMLAITILAMIMVISWTSFNTASRQGSQVIRVNERIHGVEQAMNRIVKELSMAFTTTHGQGGELLSPHYKTGFYGTDDRVDFTSLGKLRMFRDEKAGDQMEISYFVREMKNDDGEEVSTLVRREDSPIDDDPQKGGTLMPLLEGVISFHLEYWDPERAEFSGDGWVDRWDTESSQYAGRLPSRVRIQIEIPHPRGGRDNVTFTTQAEIHLTESLDF